MSISYKDFIQNQNGALPELMHRIPDTPIYCTKNGVQSLKGHYYQDWNFQVIKTGDKLSLGKKELVFVEAPMLHWPDSIFCYLTDDTIWKGTRVMAENIASGIKEADKKVNVKLFSLAKTDKCDIITEIFKSKIFQNDTSVSSHEKRNDRGD